MATQRHSSSILQPEAVTALTHSTATDFPKSEALQRSGPLTSGPSVLRPVVPAWSRSCAPRHTSNPLFRSWKRVTACRPEPWWAGRDPRTLISPITESVHAIHQETTSYFIPPQKKLFSRGARGTAGTINRFPRVVNMSLSDVTYCDGNGDHGAGTLRFEVWRYLWHQNLLRYSAKINPPKWGAPSRSPYREKAKCL